MAPTLPRFGVAGNLLGRQLLQRLCALVESTTRATISGSCTRVVGLAMAPRSNWKGYLKLSLVSASIAIYPATSSTEKVRFNTLNRATGNRLKRKMVDAVTEEEVPTEEQVKGYAVGKDSYVQVEDDELANIAIESTHTVDIEKFVPKDTIDDR